MHSCVPRTGGHGRRDFNVRSRRIRLHFAVSSLPSPSVLIVYLVGWHSFAKNGSAVAFSGAGGTCERKFPVEWPFLKIV